MTACRGSFCHLAKGKPGVCGDQWVPTGSDLLFQRHVGNAGDIFGWVLLAKDAAKHPRMHRTDSTTTNYPAPEVRGG